MTNCKNCGHVHTIHGDYLAYVGTRCHVGNCECERFEP